MDKKQVIKVFFELTLKSYLLGCVVYFMMSPFLPDSLIESFRTLEIFEFFAIIAVTFGINGTVWFIFLRNKFSIKRWSICLTLISTVFISTSVVGAYNRFYFKHADFTESYFWRNLISGGLDGFIYGWIVVLIFFPLNILSFAFGYRLLNSKVEAHEV